jgi:hypothetical protein
MKKERLTARRTFQIVVLKSLFILRIYMYFYFNEFLLIILALKNTKDAVNHVNPHHINILEHEVF